MDIKKATQEDDREYMVADDLLDPAVERHAAAEAQRHDEHNYDSGDMAMPGPVDMNGKPIEKEEPYTIGDLIRQQIRREKVEKMSNVGEITNETEVNETFDLVNHFLGENGPKISEEDFQAVLHAAKRIRAYEEIHYPKTMPMTYIFRDLFAVEHLESEGQEEESKQDNSVDPMEEYTAMLQEVIDNPNGVRLEFGLEWDDRDVLGRTETPALAYVNGMVVDGVKKLIVTSNQDLIPTPNQDIQYVDVTNPTVACAFLAGQMFGEEVAIYRKRDSLKSLFTEEQLADFKNLFGWHVCEKR